MAARLRDRIAMRLCPIILQAAPCRATPIAILPSELLLDGKTQKLSTLNAEENSPGCPEFKRPKP